MTDDVRSKSIEKNYLSSRLIRESLLRGTKRIQYIEEDPVDDERDLDIEGGPDTVHTIETEDKDETESIMK